jgi:hypothetical protein
VSYDKFKKAKRRTRTENAISRQLKIAKNWGIPTNKPHRFAKMKATNCGDPNCAMCGNPRKFFNEATLQEKRFNQNNDSEY